MRNESNKFNTDTFSYIHSTLQELSESPIMRNSKKGLFYSSPTSGKEGYLYGF